MRKVEYDGVLYDRLYHKDSDSLIKISTIPVEVWKKFCGKNLKYVNSPLEYHAITLDEIIEYDIKSSLWFSDSKRSVITLPYLKDYKTLDNTIFDAEFTTKEVLQLLKKNMNILKYIHQNGVCHGDINSSNIMINQNLDLEFIDFDSATIDEYISLENTFFEDEYSDDWKIKKTIHQDKLDLLTIYFSYLSHGNFRKKDSFLLSSLGLDRMHEQALLGFIKEKDSKDNYYYMDFIDDLIKQDYQSPIVYSKNLLHKYGK